MTLQERKRLWRAYKNASNGHVNALKMRKDVMAVIAAVCQYERINMAFLLGSTRTWKGVKPRILASLMLRKMGLSFPDIGALLNRDHSTIVHYMNLVDEARLMGMFWIEPALKAIGKLAEEILHPAAPTYGDANYEWEKGQANGNR